MNDAHDTDPAPPPPLSRRVPTLTELDARLTMVADGVLEANERLGHLMRIMASTEADVREVRSELSEMRAEDRDIRRKLDTVPELVKDAAEETGKHAITELEKRLAIEQLGETKQALVRKSDHAWQVAVVVLSAALGVVGSILVYVLTHAH